MKLSLSSILLIIISFIEGGILLSYEVCSSQILLPSLGYSLYMWASILAMSLLGLAFGYKVGGNLVKRGKSINYLFKICFLLFFNLLIIRFLIIGSEITLLSSYKLSILLYTTVVCFPTTFLLGIFSPIIISNLGGFWNYSVGIIFTSSTIGGVIMTMVSVWYITPILGISALLSIHLGIVIIIIALLYLYKKSLSNE